MRPVYGKDRLYDFLLPYVNWSFRRVFRSLRYEGCENIPADGPVIFSPNHVNTLLDALAVLAMMDGRPVVFAARADIFRKKSLAAILNFLRILPINRMRDGIDSLAGNEDTFRQAVRSLKEGLPFCIFPEGRHSQEEGLLPLRKGIARIALKASEEIPGPIYIVPVGLTYKDYIRFHTSLTVQVGEAIRINPDTATTDNDSAGTVPGSNKARRSRLLLNDLSARMRRLIDRPLSQDRGNILSFLLFPLVPFAGLLMIPAFSLITFLKGRIEDKAFMNSIRYVACYLVNPPAIFLLSLLLLILALIPWWLALLLPGQAFSHRKSGMVSGIFDII